MSEQAKILYIDKEVGSKFTVSDANSIKSVVNQHAGSIDLVTGDIQDVTNRVQTLESAGGNGGGDNTELTVSLTTISGTVDTITGQIDTISGTVDTITGQIDTISGTVDTITGQIDSMSGTVDTITGQIDTISGTVDTITGQIDTISGTVDTIEGQINTITGEVAYATGAAVAANKFAAEVLITSLENAQHIETISGRVDTLEDSAGGGGSDNTELTNSLTTISGTVDTITGQIDTISGTVDTITGQIDTISGTVDTITGQIDTISGTVDTITGQIDTISGTVDANTIAIVANSTSISTAIDQTKIYKNIDADDLTENFITLDLVHYDKFYITVSNSVSNSDKWIDSSDPTQPPLLQTKLLTSNDQSMYSFEALFEYNSFSNPWVGQGGNKTARLILDEPALYYNDTQNDTTSFNASTNAPIEKLYCTYHKGNSLSLNVSDVQLNGSDAIDRFATTLVPWDLSSTTHTLMIPTEFLPSEGSINTLRWPGQIGIYEYYIEVQQQIGSFFWDFLREDVQDPGSIEHLNQNFNNSTEYNITTENSVSTINIASPPSQLITQYHYINPSTDYMDNIQYTDESTNR